jgi:hypothetical protein
MLETRSFTLFDTGIDCDILAQSQSSVVVGNASQITQINGSSAMLSIADQVLSLASNANKTIVSTPGNLIFASLPDQQITIGSTLGEHISISPTDIHINVGELKMSFADAGILSANDILYITYFRRIRRFETIYKSPDELSAMSTIDQAEYTSTALPELFGAEYTNMMYDDANHTAIVSSLFLRRNVMYDITLGVFIVPYTSLLEEYEAAVVSAQEAFDMTESEYGDFMDRTSQLYNQLILYEDNTAIELASSPSAIIDALIERRRAVWISPRRLEVIESNEAFRAMLTYYNTADATAIDMLGILPSVVGTRLSPNYSLIGIWNTSELLSISTAFLGNSTFNIDISRWNVEKVVDMSGVFMNATIFNQDLSLWRPCCVTNMNKMFNGASSYNHSVNAWGPMLVVTNMDGTFANAVAYNQPMDLWDTRNCVNMARMFLGAVLFDQDISLWHVYKVHTMYRMFMNATAFNQNLKRWRVINVTNFDYMYSGATHFMQEDILQWVPHMTASFYQMFVDSSMLSFSEGTPEIGEFRQRKN